MVSPMEDINDCSDNTSHSVIVGPTAKGMSALEPLVDNCLPLIFIVDIGCSFGFNIRLDSHCKE